jgi:hypothetical protein
MPPFRAGFEEELPKVCKKVDKTGGFPNVDVVGDRGSC